MDHFEIPETQDNGEIVLMETPGEFGTHRYIESNYHQVTMDMSVK